MARSRIRTRWESDAGQAQAEGARGLLVGDRVLSIGDWAAAGFELVEGRVDLRGLPAAGLVWRRRSGRRWQGLDLSEAVLTDARLESGEITDCLLDRADLSDSHFHATVIRDTRARGVNLRGAGVAWPHRGRRTQWLDVDLGGATLRSAAFRQGVFRGVDFTGARWGKSYIDTGSSIFQDCRFTGPFPPTIFRDRDTLDPVDDQVNEMTGCDFSSADIWQVEFRNLAVPDLIWPLADPDLLVFQPYIPILHRLVEDLPRTELLDARVYAGVIAKHHLKWAHPRRQIGFLHLREFRAAAEALPVIAQVLLDAVAACQGTVLSTAFRTPAPPSPGPGTSTAGPAGAAEPHAGYLSLDPNLPTLRLEPRPTDPADDPTTVPGVTVEFPARLAALLGVPLDGPGSADVPEPARLVIFDGAAFDGAAGPPAGVDDPAGASYPSYPSYLSGLTLGPAEVGKVADWLNQQTFDELLQQHLDAVFHSHGGEYTAQDHTRLLTAFDQVCDLYQTAADHSLAIDKYPG